MPISYQERPLLTIEEYERLPSWKKSLQKIDLRKKWARPPYYFKVGDGGAIVKVPGDDSNADISVREIAERTSPGIYIDRYHYWCSLHCLTIMIAAVFFGLVMGGTLGSVFVGGMIVVGGASICAIILVPQLILRMYEKLCRIIIERRIEDFIQNEWHHRNINTEYNHMEVIEGNRQLLQYVRDDIVQHNDIKVPDNDGVEFDHDAGMMGHSEYNNSVKLEHNSVNLEQKINFINYAIKLARQRRKYSEIMSFPFWCLKSPYDYIGESGHSCFLLRMKRGDKEIVDFINSYIECCKV